MGLRLAEVKPFKDFSGIKTSEDLNGSKILYFESLDFENLYLVEYLSSLESSLESIQHRTLIQIEMCPFENDLGEWNPECSLYARLLEFEKSNEKILVPYIRNHSVTSKVVGGG